MINENSKEIKVKQFCGFTHCLESKINEWLSANDVLVVEIKYQMCWQENGMQDSVLIVYKEK